MRIRFWGVRGSIAAPGPSTVRAGGNTACVSVEVGAGIVAFDAGTGVRAFGESLKGDRRDIFMIFTHPHADHVQGLPFFAPISAGGQSVHLLDNPSEHGGWTALDLFDGVSNPLTREALSPSVKRVEGDALGWLARRGVDVRRFAASHPGGCWAYRLEEGGRSYVHMTDNEIGEGDEAFLQACAEFARGADVLCHDAQYLRAEMRERAGWGHTSVERACDLARAAGVRHLVLFHHDPSRDDHAVDALERTARESLAPAGIRCDAAREGMTIEA